MFDSLFDHIKKHKRAYGLGLVAVLLAVGAFGYYGAPNMNDDSLAGRITKSVTDRISKKPIKPTTPCTESAWRCSAFLPDECPESEVRTRTCKLVDKKCSDPNAVKPVETEACEYAAPVTSEMQVAAVAAPSTLSNGEKTFLAFSVTPDQTVHITAMNFDVALTDYQQDGLTVTGYKLYRGSNMIQMSDSPSFTLNETETIAAGSTQSYKLVGAVAGAKDGDTILTMLTVNGLVTDATVMGLPILFQLGEEAPQPADATVTQVASSSALSDAGANLISFSVTADASSAGTVAITGMNFVLDIADADNGGELSVLSYKLYDKNGVLIASSSTPSFTFTPAKTVAAGTPETYALKAEVTGSEMDDLIYTTLPAGGLVTSSNVTGLPISHAVMK